MITIKAWTDRRHLYLSATGHAAYHPGNDIVCAAVSALLCTLAIGDKNARLLSGEAQLSLARTRDNCAVYRAVIAGLREISRSYAAHVRVEVGASRTDGYFFSKEWSS